MPELTVGSFNIHWGHDRRYRVYDVVSAFGSLNCDVIVVEEAWWPDGGAGPVEAAAAALGYRVLTAPLTSGVLAPRPHLALIDEKPDGKWGIAILTRPEVVSSRRIDLGRLALDPSPRAALEVQLSVDGAPLTLVGTHLSHLTHGSVVQLRLLRDALPGSDAPAVLAGDMNMWGPVVSRLLPGWRRAVLGRTFPSHRPHSQIDHVLVTQSVEVLQGEVLPPLGSDHRAIRARIRF